VVHVEGDPDHPINRGTLCPKGASLQQDILNERRIVKPQVRRPGSDHWEDISWENALSEIAQKVKKTRDDSFIEKDAQGKTVNRCESIAWTGGCTEYQRIQLSRGKTMRALGVVHLGKPGPRLTRPYGLKFGTNVWPWVAMTNGWVDIKNTDMMLIMGGNPAENHPCGFKWAIEAKRNRNAKMVG